MSPVEPGGEGFDPVALAVISSRIEGIVRRMTNTLFRTARSSVLNTARDFSCCIVTRDHELLACGESLPIHVMSGPDMVAAATARLHPHPRRAMPTSTTRPTTATPTRPTTASWCRSSTPTASSR